MSRRLSSAFALVLLCLPAAGCSSFGRSQGTTAADKIAVYQGVPRDPRSYELVKRIWAEKWRSSLWVPSFGSEEDAMSDLRNQAVSLGGDAIMNFGCYRRDADIPHAERPNLLCNGNVIKYVQ